MLYRPRNSAGDIKLGSHRLPGLAYLAVMGNPSCVHHRAGRAGGAAQHLRQFLNQVVMLRPAYAPATRDYDIRFFKVYRLCSVLHHFFYAVEQVPVGYFGIKSYNLAASSVVRLPPFHYVWPHGGHLRPVVGRQYGGHYIPPEGRPGLAQKSGIRFYRKLGAVGGKAGIDSYRNPCSKVPAVMGGSKKHNVWLIFFDKLRKGRGIGSG